ncbi:putative ribonuclease H domain-containing protein [Arabidopsis thaliana]
MLTRVWKDPWIPTILARPAKSILNIRDSLLYVNDLIDQNTNLWKLDRLQALIDPVDIPLILGIRPSRTYLSDGFSWSHTKSGNYTVKSGYWVARDLSRPTCDPPFQGPGNIFPRNSLFYNFDFLFWRDREFGIGEKVLELFPWIIWYIWKSKNRFVFENFREPPPETLVLALQETAVWKQATLKEDDSTRPIVFVGSSQTPSTLLPECQLDASWHVDDTLSGHGWVLVRQDLVIHLGLKSTRRNLSPLHAEFNSLLWAMECMISIGDTSGTFASDCSDLIAILDNQDDWLTFAAELASYRSLVCFFPSFRIRFLPRSSNTRADCLAKKARTRNSLFSHVSTLVPKWLSLAESLFPIT